MLELVSQGFKTLEWFDLVRKILWVVGFRLGWCFVFCMVSLWGVLQFQYGFRSLHSDIASSSTACSKAASCKQWYWQGHQGGWRRHIQRYKAGMVIQASKHGSSVLCVPGTG